MKAISIQFFKKIKSFFSTIWLRKKEKKVWIPTIALVLILLGMFSGGGAGAEVYTYNVQPREFVQSVSLTGKVIAAKNVDMGFEVSGRVQSVKVKVGDRVKAGAVLASLSNGDYVASLQKNYALALSEDARLRDIQSGSKRDDIASAQTDVTNAQSDLELARQSLSDQLRDVYAKADDAVRFKIDNAFINPRSSNPEFAYQVDQNIALKNSLGTQRLLVGEMLVQWNKNISMEQITTIRTYISQVQKFITDANTAISIVGETVGQNDTGYADVLARKTDIAAARTSFSASVSALNQAEITYKNTANALAKTQNILTSKLSGTNTDLDIQTANLKSAQAGVTNAQALVSKTMIRAPFDGVITKVDIKEGEISSPNTPVIGLLNDGEYQIETFVSENDVAKLKVGQVAKVTLDAYGRSVFFDASVISIDPAETVKDGVSTYRTKIQFISKDERIKSGMTANIDIETNRRQDILVIPQAALFLDKGVKKIYVLTSTACIGENSAISTTTPVLSPTCFDVLKNKKDVRVVEIQTGEINNAGDIEILTGLSTGDVLLYSPKTTQ